MSKYAPAVFVDAEGPAIFHADGSRVNQENPGRRDEKVTIYATGLGEALGMSAHDVEGLRTAALLHDAGQLAVPEHILAKPGRLTEEEFDRVRIHPAVGAGIISGIDYPYPVASLILSHHERWDGQGYPEGLAGEAIPRGLGILADYGRFLEIGKRDIWTNVPDVLASTANYFSKAVGGWKWGVPWGFEVLLPKGFDLMKSRATYDEWTALGVKRADGKPFPKTGDGILFFPTGLPGPAFIVTPNFDVIKDYNDSDVYALAIGHLSDLMQGGGPFKTPWPAHGTQLPRDDRIALQKKLAELGYDQTRFSAHIDFKMRDFVRAEQKKYGLVTDGHSNAALLDRMGVQRTPQ